MPTEAENIKSTKGTSRLTQKHQVTIPKGIRETLGLEAGDTVAFEEGPDGEVRIRKIPPSISNSRQPWKRPCQSGIPILMKKLTATYELSAIRRGGAFSVHGPSRD